MDILGELTTITCQLKTLSVAHLSCCGCVAKKSKNKEGLNRERTAAEQKAGKFQFTDPHCHCFDQVLSFDLSSHSPRAKGGSQTPVSGIQLWKK